MRMSSVISITSIALLLLSGAEATILTLSCDGTMTNLAWNSDHKPEPVTNMGLVVNLSEGTVTGFAFPASIYKTDATRVEFKGENGNWSVWGSIDRNKVEVSDEEIAEAIRIMLSDTHTLTEGAGAAAFAALIKERDRLQGRRVAVIVTGLRRAIMSLISFLPLG
jgi:hypothetical protein